MKTTSIGFGSMVYTVIYRDASVQIRTELVSGSHDKKIAWRQTQKKV